MLAAPRATGLRWYSAKDSLQPSESRTYSFGDVQKQLHINEQLEKSGAEETATGQKKVVFVGSSKTPARRLGYLSGVSLLAYEQSLFCSLPFRRLVN